VRRWTNISPDSIMIRSTATRDRECTVGSAETECQLMAVIHPGAGAAERLAAALAAGEIASVVVAVPDSAETAVADIRTLIEQAQAAGAAALVRDDARLARTLKADGVHLSVDGGPDVKGGAKGYGEAREIVGRGLIVGVDAGRSRHDAMEAGEAGADYVAFGIPDRVGDREKAHLRRCELVAWWAEVFEVPVVAFDVVDPAEAAALAAAGADFIAVTLPAREPPAASGELVRAVIAAIAAEVVT
jgi:thiamine-phosphate pyrophosphorylase